MSCCTESARSARTDCGPGCSFIEELGLSRDIGRNPCWKWGFHKRVFAGCGVVLMKLSQLFGRNLVANTHQGRPKALVDKGDFGSNEAADKHCVQSSNRPRNSKDLLRAWVRPPIALDGLPRNRFGQRGHRAASGFQHNPVLDHKSSGFLQVHSSVCVVTGLNGNWVARL